MQAIRIIHDEHRSLAAVLHGMLYLVHEIRDRGAKPNFDVFGAMVYYIDAFPERFHHPKEDDYLFRALRIRYPDAKPLLDRLEGEHWTGAHKIRTLEQALARYQQGGASEFPSFAAAVAEFHWSHMRAEETEVLPLAETHLSPDDWEAIDEAFLVTPIHFLSTRWAPSTRRCSPASATWRRPPLGWARRPSPVRWTASDGHLARPD